MTTEMQNPIFSFDTSDAQRVHISLTDIGRELVTEPDFILENLKDHLDENLRNAGYMYNITSTDETITISPFEEVEPFNQEVFDIIAEELQFTDRFVRDEAGVPSEDIEDEE